VRGLLGHAWLWFAGGGLAVALGAVILALRLRAHRKGGRTPAPALLCPTCRRGYPAGLRFCPLDAGRLQPSSEGAQAAHGHGGKCPRCRRAFEAGVRFCPMDAEELVPLERWQAMHGEPGGPHDHTFADHLLGGDGKICPVCASRYDLEAGFCGRDASELVTIN
jgi:uncharacterized protein YbaR (Trm112 family)